MDASGSAFGTHSFGEVQGNSSGWQNTGYFDASQSHNLWGGTSNTAIHSRQAGSSPFDGTINGLAPVFLNSGSPDFFFSAGGPTGLQHRLEVPLGPTEGEEDGDGVVGSGPPKQEIKRIRGRIKGSKATNTRTQRIPHNKVEKKYRDALNAEMERLRAHIPTLPKYDGSFTAPLKPSKAMVLAAAVDYIMKLEAENKRLVEENKRIFGTGGRPLSIGRREVSRRKQ